jgi:hypothetical protein
MKKLRHKMNALQRKKTVLDSNTTEIPATSMLNGILVIPASVSSEKIYKLPLPKQLITSSNMSNGYSVYIRNDSAHPVTIISDNKKVTIDGANTIGSTTGSKWYLSLHIDENNESYEFIRLI